MSSTSSLERDFVSFLIITATIYLRVGVATLKQLLFALERQWTLVHSKLFLWFIFAEQSSIEHYRKDFNFEFAWLKKKP
uniref:Uncharacterized protein n=1 Tax=Globisporangium ultimum (strain ATCC 200006 / CBS 805.95 / DAOM BR144) TaxID=431595 RepID=K3X6E4_GLOUD